MTVSGTAGPAPSDALSLEGKLLIAMPGMGDPRFDKSVIYLCAHSAREAMGLIVNKPAARLRFRELLGQLGIEAGADCADLKVHYGGPVEQGRGFVLHSADYTSNSSTLRVDDRFGMTATLDVLEDMARGMGPARCDRAAVNRPGTAARRPPRRRRARPASPDARPA